MTNFAFHSMQTVTVNAIGDVCLEIMQYCIVLVECSICL